MLSGSISGIVATVTAQGSRILEQPENTRDLTNMLGWLAILACLAGLLVSAGLWAFASKSQNPEGTFNAKRGALVSIFAALAIGALPHLINAFDEAVRPFSPAVPVARGSECDNFVGAVTPGMRCKDGTIYGAKDPNIPNPQQGDARVPTGSDTCPGSDEPQAPGTRCADGSITGQPSIPGGPVGAPGTGSGQVGPNGETTGRCPETGTQLYRWGAPCPNGGTAR